MLKYTIIILTFLLGTALAEDTSAPDDIPDGTKVRLGDGGVMEFHRTRYIWQDGQLIPQPNEK